MLNVNSDPTKVLRAFFLTAQHKSVVLELLYKRHRILHWGLGGGVALQKEVLKHDLPHLSR